MMQTAGDAKRVHWSQNGALLALPADCPEDIRGLHGEAVCLLQAAHEHFYRAIRSKTPYGGANDRIEAIKQLREAVKITDEMDAKAEGTVDLPSLIQKVKVCAHVLLLLSYEGYLCGGAVRQWEILHQLQVDPQSCQALKEDLIKKYPSHLF